MLVRHSPSPLVFGRSGFQLLPEAKNRDVERAFGGLNGLDKKVIGVRVLACSVSSIFGL